MKRDEFIQKVKTKYPQYQNVGNDILWEKLTDKYGSKLDAYGIEYNPIDTITKNWNDKISIKQPGFDNFAAQESTYQITPLTQKEEEDDGLIDGFVRESKINTVLLTKNMLQYLDGVLPELPIKDEDVINYLEEEGLRTKQEIDKLRTDAQTNIENDIFRKTDNYLEKLLDSPGLRRPENFEPVGRHNWYKPQVIMETLGSTIPSIVGMIGAGMAAGPPGLYTAMFGMGASQSYVTAIEAGEDEDKAKRVSALVGLVTTGIGAMRYAPYLKFLPGGQKLGAHKLTDSLIRRGVGVRVPMTMAKESLKEGIEEWLQEITQMVGEGFTVKGFPDFSEASQRAFTAYYAGALSGTALGTVRGYQENKIINERKDFAKKYGAKINRLTPDRFTYNVQDNSIKINTKDLSGDEIQAIDDSGLKDRLKIDNLTTQYPDMPYEMAILTELNKNSEHLKNVDVELDLDDNTTIFSSDELIEMGYGDYKDRFKNSLVEEGEVEYDPRQRQYRVQINGFNEVATDGSGRIVLKRGATADTITEEQVEVVYKRLADTNPQLRQNIDNFLDNVRTVYESNGYTPPSNTELFSKITTFNVLGYAEHDLELTTMTTLPESIRNEFLAELGKQTDGTNLSFLYSSGKPKVGILPVDVVEDTGVEPRIDTDSIVEERGPPGKAVGTAFEHTVPIKGDKVYTTSFDRDFKDLVEEEVGERENYTEEEVNQWKEKYNLDDDTQVTWVSPLKWVANRYVLNASEWDKADKIPESEMDVDEINIDENITVIEESSDGEAGYLIAKKPADKSFQLTPTQEEFFKDTKITDDDGKPKVVYHSTFADFKEFDMAEGDIGIHFGTSKSASDRITDKLQTRWQAQPRKGAKTIPVLLDIKNPLRVDDPYQWGDMWELEPVIKKALEEEGSDLPSEGLETPADVRRVVEDLGYDGIVYENIQEDPGQDSYIAFKPEQVKSVFNTEPDATEKTFQITEAREVKLEDGSYAEEMVGESEGIVFLGGDAVSIDMEGNPHPSGYRYPEKYVKQGSGWQLSKQGATRIKNLAEKEGLRSIAIVVYRDVLNSMKVNPIYQKALEREIFKNTVKGKVINSLKKVRNYMMQRNHILKRKHLWHKRVLNLLR